jgi:glycosyltransferase involved in cell wall biosynthesis
MTINEISKEKLVVAHITDVVDGRRNSGTARVAVEHIQNLSKFSDIKQVLIHFEGKKDSIYFLPNIEEIVIPLKKFPFARHFFSFFIYWFPKYIFRQQDPFDIVHWHSSRVFPFFFLIPARKIFITLHDANNRILKNTNTFWTEIFYWNLRFFVSKIHTIFGDSIDACGKLVSVGKFPKNKVKCLYLGSNFETVKSKNILNFEPTQLYFLCVSRWQPFKNVETLVEAYAKVLSIKPDAPNLVLVGKPVAGHDKPSQVLNRYSLQHKVLIFQDLADEQLALLYRNAIINISPSLNEGFGLSVLEGIKCGCPSIDHKYTSTSEISGPAGIHIDMNSIDTIAEKLIEILENPQIINELKANISQRSRDFHWDNTTAKLLNYYQI